MSSTTARPLAAVTEGVSAVKSSAAPNAPAARLRKNPARLQLGQPVWIESTGRSAFALCRLYNHYLGDFVLRNVSAFCEWWSHSCSAGKNARRSLPDICLRRRDVRHADGRLQ